MDSRKILLSLEIGSCAVTTALILGCGASTSNTPPIVPNTNPASNTAEVRSQEPTDLHPPDSEASRVIREPIDAHGFRTRHGRERSSITDDSPKGVKLSEIEVEQVLNSLRFEDRIVCKYSADSGEREVKMPATAIRGLRRVLSKNATRFTELDCTPREPFATFSTARGPIDVIGQVFEYRVAKSNSIIWSGEEISALYVRMEEAFIEDRPDELWEYLSHQQRNDEVK